MDDKWPRIHRDTKQLRKRLRKVPYSGQLIPLITDYSNSLDSPNLEEAYHGLWRVLEHVTDSIGEYKLLERRAAFVYKEAEFHTVILEHLRKVRNRSIHFGDEVLSNVVF
jgi:hypothetical protein